jgi:hypothetical protein
VHFKLTKSMAAQLRHMSPGESVVFCLLAGGEPAGDEPKPDGFFGVVLRDGPLPL